MKSALLFWFYKEPEICENHLKILKRHNPSLEIFGLYGGKKNEAKKYKIKLEKYLDDFYISPFVDPDWKWINGDLMILNWYNKRGRNLNWDSIFVIQWDTLVFDSLIKQFPKIKKDEIFLSGLRSLNQVVENRWYWTRPGSRERKNYLRFLEHIKINYNYAAKPLCCLFIFQVFPKIFFEKYLSVKNKEIGMLEYKIPTYAKIFKVPFYEKDSGVRWFKKEEKPLNAVSGKISDNYIKKELNRKNGRRVFHPYYGIWSE